MKSRRRFNSTIMCWQVIRQLDYERIQAQIDADAAALERIYASDFIGVGPSGAVRTKPQVISDFTSGELKFQSITTDEVQVRIYGNTAVETGRSTMNGQDRGKAVPRDNRFATPYQRQHNSHSLHQRCSRGQRERHEPCRGVVCEVQHSGRGAVS